MDIFFDVECDGFLISMMALTKQILFAWNQSILVFRGAKATNFKMVFVGFIYFYEK